MVILPDISQQKRVKMTLHLFHFDIYLLQIVSFIIFGLCWYFPDRPHGTALKIYRHYDCKTLLHVHNYVFVHGTNHASLKFLHTIEPKLRVMMQVRRLRWPSVQSNDTACTSVSHSVTLRLSVSAVCFNAICRCSLPIRLAVYLQHQTVDPVCI